MSVNVKGNYRLEYEVYVRRKCGIVNWIERILLKSARQRSRVSSSCLTESRILHWMKQISCFDSQASLFRISGGVIGTGIGPPPKVHYRTHNCPPPVSILGQPNPVHILTYLFTYLLTPRCRVLPEQLTGLQLVKKFPAFHGNPNFITALTSVRHLSLSWASPIQSIYLLTYLLTYLLHGAESFLSS